MGSSGISQPARTESLLTPSVSETSHSPQQTCPGSGNGDQPMEHLLDSAGLLTQSAGSVTYVGNGHWMAILEGIRGLNDVLTAVPMPSQDASESGDCERPEKSDILCPLYNKLDRQDVLDALPPKATVDALLRDFFINTSHEPMIVHGPTFHQEYAQFWADPTSTPIAWVGLLFALMSLAVNYQQFSPNQSPDHAEVEKPDSLVKTFRDKTIECLLLSKYTNGPPYAIEALLIHLFGDFIRGDSTQNVNEFWVLWGAIVQIALRAGYHRDGSHFPTLTPFQAETRRRVWAIMVEWDMYISVSFGLPRAILMSQSDTAQPRNLKDEDLHVDMVEMPPARPESEYTRVRYHLDMNRLMGLLSIIADATSSTTLPPMSEILRLDNLLLKTYQSISSTWPPVDSSYPRDTVHVIFLILLFHHAQIALHRKYLPQGRKQAQYRHSRKTCIEAGLAILHHQWTLYLQTRVGGPLCRQGWKLLTPLVSDFLLATAILCAELAMALESAGSGHDGDAELLTERDLQDRVFHALSSAYVVWLYANDADASREVKTMVAVLDHLLGKAQDAGFGAWRPSLSAIRQSGVGGHESTGEQHTVATTTGMAVLDEQPSKVPYFGLAHFPI
ncbi:hypothetical protein A1O1_04703 [Capronia coronata CBS 617.96]|uniref:Xylanolytic transcriptional activator regulatory domain-containing protein n=1 Tax=Capronia coronata CBS 617.96 TaxID=1182541 RepID=W9YET7_9EURO|nr:uncharacterized protein A1O1_04703 [Capronia coronata CBS 617.96]EXJ87776.1 hypothetical protein A1O1_04703 [Capronia coronata CBS 617.96]